MVGRDRKRYGFVGIVGRKAVWMRRRDEKLDKVEEE